MKNKFKYLSNIHFHFRARVPTVQFVSANLLVMFSTFLILPMILQAYGVEYLGLFSLILSINIIVPLMDFGYANSISIEVSRMTGYSTLFNSRNRLRTNFLVLPGIVIVMTATITLYHVSFIYTSINGILSTHEIKITVLAMTLHSLLLIVFNVAYKIRLALNLYKLSSTVLTVNSIIVLLSSASSVWLQSSFTTFLITYLLSSWLANLFFLRRTIKLLLAEYAQLQVSREHGNRIRRRRIPGDLTFFIAQVSTIFAYQLDNFVVVRYLSLEDVAVYSSAIKFIALPIAIFASYSLPLWTETSRGSFGTNDAQIFGNLSRILEKRLLIIVPFAILAYFTLPLVLKIWSSGKLQVSQQFTICLVLWLITAVITQPIAMVTNGMLFHRFIIMSGVVGALLNISISVFLCKYFNLMSGPIIGSILAQIASSLIPYFYFQRKISKHG